MDGIRHELDRLDERIAIWKEDLPAKVDDKSKDARNIYRLRTDRRTKVVMGRCRMRSRDGAKL